MLFSLQENNLTDGIFEQLGKLTLDQVKTLNLSKNKFSSNGIRILFEQKSLVKINFNKKFYILLFRII
jgi:hypothetical protein